jgi:molybdate transport system substrate-binding protein
MCEIIISRCFGDTLKKILVLGLVGVLLLTCFAGCTDNSADAGSEKIYDGKTLRLCCGAGLMKPMNDIIANFENETGAKVQVHYGGSAELFGVLTTTGECDVFIPGAYKYTQDAMNGGYILNETVLTVVDHVPVIAVPQGNPKNVQSLEDLARDDVKVVLGDPQACAIGKTAKSICEKNGVWEDVNSNVEVFTPTVNQLLIYEATGQADATIIWEDMVTWAESEGKIVVIQIPKDQNTIKTIPTAVTTMAEDVEVAKAFNDYVVSEESLEIWQNWGFNPCN